VVSVRVSILSIISTPGTGYYTTRARNPM
jgi:hypothetical protein